MRYSYYVAACGVLATAACSSSSGDLADARIVAIDAHEFDARGIDSGEVLPPPMTTITSAPAAATTDAEATFAFTSSQPDSTFQCKLDGGTAATCASPYSISVEPGDHTMLVQAINDHDIVDQTGALASWNYHVAVAGTVAITSGPSGYFTTDPAPTFAFALTGDIASVSCSLDSAAATACTTPYAPGTLTDGDHTVTVAIIDQLGGTSSDSRSFTLDTTPEPVWTQVTPATSPGPRSAQAMVYDEANQNIVMFGGSLDDTGDLGTDTWTWDGATWTQRITQHAPPGSWSPAMTFDTTNQNVVLVSGDGGPATGSPADTWIWDGTDWTQAQPVHAPSARINTMMANDPVRGRVVLFGGAIDNVNQNDTWEWDGTDWTQISPTISPPERCLHQMIFDGNAIVMNGGNGITSSFLDDTWTYDGTTWTQATTVFTPPARWMSTMMYDSVLGRVVMFGGLDASESGINDTWEWNGSQWRQRAPLTSPATRWQYGGAYDELHQQVVVYAGIYLSDTWLLQ